MKRLLIIPLLLLIFPVLAFSAGSSTTVSSDNIYYNGKTEEVMRVIVVAFTADDGTGAIPDLVLSAGTTGINYPMIGWWGLKIRTDGNHAGTEPQEDSEVYIYEAGFDLLAGGGVNNLDNTAEREIMFMTGSTIVKQLCTGTWTLTITQQAAAVSSATGTVTIVLTGK